MTDPLVKWTQAYEGGRMLATMGQVQIGAVFPPADIPRDGTTWVWRFWLSGLHHHVPEGRAKTEQAAKNALLGHLRDWLRAAGLRQEEQAHG